MLLSAPPSCNANGSVLPLCLYSSRDSLSCSGFRPKCLAQHALHGCLFSFFLLCCGHVTLGGTHLSVFGCVFQPPAFGACSHVCPSTGLTHPTCLPGEWLSSVKDYVEGYPQWNIPINTLDKLTTFSFGPLWRLVHVFLLQCVHNNFFVSLWMCLILLWGWRRVLTHYWTISV